MYERNVKGKREFIFKDKKEFRKHLPIEPLEPDWRTARSGYYTLADDGQVVKILYKKQFKNKKAAYYVRTLLGLRRTDQNKKLDGKPKKNIYSFSDEVYKTESISRRKNPTGREVLFARYVANGENVVKAYLKVYETTNEQYAGSQARMLLKQDRIIRMISKENIKSLKNIGIDRDYLFEKTKDVIENLEGKDSDKLRAIELLMKIKDMFPKEEKREALTVFQGFSKEQIQKLNAVDEIKPIAHAQRELKEEND